MDSEAWTSAKPSSIKLLLDLFRSFNGKNNGALTCTFREMSARGWRSTETLERAKRELLDRGLIEQTRQGGLSLGKRRPSMFAVTWLPIDRIENQAGQHILDVAATRVASGRWSKS